MSFQLKRNTTTILKIGRRQRLCSTPLRYIGNNTRALVFSDMFRFEFEVVERISHVLTYRTVTSHTLSIQFAAARCTDLFHQFSLSAVLQCLLKMTTNMMRCSRVFLAAAGRLRHHSLCSLSQLRTQLGEQINGDIFFIAR